MYNNAALSNVSSGQNQMSVVAQQSSSEYQTKDRVEVVYQKFQKAHENMSNFQEMLSKFSTQKKTHRANPDPPPRSFTQRTFEASKTKMLNLTLSDGWEYSGEVFEDRFHGFGHLLLKGQSVYSGEFKNGRFHGLGKLKFNETFEQLVAVDEEWTLYEGEFRQGMVNGFGNLYLAEGTVKTGCWKKGYPQYFTKVDAQALIE